MASPYDKIFDFERLKSPRQCIACWWPESLVREFPEGTGNEPLWRCGKCQSTLNHVHLTLTESGADAVMEALGPEWLNPTRFRALKRRLWNLFADTYEFQEMPDDPEMPGANVCGKCGGSGIYYDIRDEQPRRAQDCPKCNSTTAAEGEADG